MLIYSTINHHIKTLFQPSSLCLVSMSFVSLFSGHEYYAKMETPADLKSVDFPSLNVLSKSGS